MGTILCTLLFSLLTVRLALAQATAPSAPGDASAGQRSFGNTADLAQHWWWIGLIVVAALIAFFVARRRRGRRPQ
jgi:hypothetical protein